MHILWVKNELLHPLDKGGRIRTYEMLRRLRDHHRVTYLALDDGTITAEQRERALEYCDELVIVPWRGRRCAASRAALAAVRNLFSSLPFALAPVPLGGDDPRDPRALRPRSRSRRRRGVRLPHAGAQRPRRICGCPVVLFQHNVEAMIWERRAKVASNPVVRLYMREQWRRMQRVRAGRSACASTTSSPSRPEDAAVLPRSATASSACRRCRRGWTPSSSAPSGAVSRDAGLDRLHRLDGLDAERGRHGVLRRGRPAARATRDRRSATLTIVGRNPTARVRALAEGGRDITVTGTVPDVRPYLRGRVGRRRAASHRRRDADQDLRGDGHGARRRLDDDRRGRVGRRRWRAHTTRRRSAVVRRRGDRPAARAGARGADRSAAPRLTFGPISAGPQSPSSSPIAVSPPRPAGTGRLPSCP